MLGTQWVLGGWQVASETHEQMRIGDLASRQTTPTPYAAYAIYATTAVVLVISAWPALQLAPADHIGLLLRITARLAFALLLLAYIARPLAQLLGGVAQPVTRQLIRQRRHLGLSMAAVHTIHFGYVVAYLQHSGEALATIVAVFGGLAFVLMWLMAATSNQAARRRLGTNWQRLHRFGMHYLWLIFMQTFVGVAQSDAASPLYYALVGAGFLALGLRISAYFFGTKSGTKA